LIKQSRLSVMPIDYKSWKKIYKMSNINWNIGSINAKKKEKNKEIQEG
jgi:membrane protein insertase Oxa1/YidC/SpoIIIJ